VRVCLTVRIQVSNVCFCCGQTTQKMGGNVSALDAPVNAEATVDVGTMVPVWIAPGPDQPATQILVLDTDTPFEMIAVYLRLMSDVHGTAALHPNVAAYLHLIHTATDCVVPNVSLRLNNFPFAPAFYLKDTTSVMPG
jgi:hypothetical protein